MSNRFHNKFHKHNHHTRGTDRDNLYPDSAYDPIASPDSPFQGEFYVDGDITSLSSVSAQGNISGTDGVFHGNVLVEGDLTVLGAHSRLETEVYVTSALDVTNTGSSPALQVTQQGGQDISQFYGSFEGGNRDIVRIKHTGSVGIGVLANENFNEKLTVVGGISATGDINSARNITADKNLRVKEDTIIDGKSFLSGNTFIGSNLIVDQDLLVVLSTTNKVGINTEEPLSELSVVGDISGSKNATFNENLQLSGSSFIDGSQRVSGNFYLSGNQHVNRDLIIQRDGVVDNKVGINTAVPNCALTVWGKICATNDVMFGGTAFISGSNLVLGNQEIAGTSFLSGNSLIDGTIRIKTIDQGITENVIIHDQGTLKTRTPNSQIWDTSAEFLSSKSLDIGNVPKYTGPNTLSKSPITVDVDNSVIIDADVLGSQNIYAQGGSSLNWNSVYNRTRELSGFWDGTFTTLRGQSANNVSVYSSVSAASANWNNTFTNFRTQSANNISVYSSVSAASANWDTGYTLINTQFANNQSVYTSVLANSANWNRGYDGYTVTSIQSANNNALYSAVISNSASWNAAAGGSIFTQVNTTSANWNNTFTNFSAQSARNLSVFSSVSAASANWNNTFTNFSVQSARNISVFSSVSAASANWNNTFTNFSAQSARILSVFSTVSANSGGWGVGGGGSGVDPLTAANWTWTYETVKDNYLTWGSGLSGEAVFTKVNLVSANWDSTFTDFSAQSANNISVFSSVSAASANWNNTFTDFSAQSANNISVFSSVSAASANWNNTFTDFSAQSANNISVFSSVSAASANWDSTFTNFRTQSANNISVYSSVSAASANWDTVYSFHKSNSAVATFSVSVSSPTISAGVYYGDGSRLTNLNINPSQYITTSNGGSLSGILSMESKLRQNNILGSIQTKGYLDLESTYFPKSLACYGENQFYFVDGNCIRKYDHGVITVVAGTLESTVSQDGFALPADQAGSAKFLGPRNLVLDPSKTKLYFLSNTSPNSISSTIRCLDLVTGIVSTIVHFSMSDQRETFIKCFDIHPSGLWIFGAFYQFSPTSDAYVYAYIGRIPIQGFGATLNEQPLRIAGPQYAAGAVINTSTVTPSSARFSLFRPPAVGLYSSILNNTNGKLASFYCVDDIVCGLSAIYVADSSTPSRLKPEYTADGESYKYAFNSYAGTAIRAVELTGTNSVYTVAGNITPRLTRWSSVYINSTNGTNAVFGGDVKLALNPQQNYLLAVERHVNYPVGVSYWPAANTDKYDGSFDSAYLTMRDLGCYVRRIELSGTRAVTTFAGLSSGTNLDRDKEWNITRDGISTQARFFRIQNICFDSTYSKIIVAELSYDGSSSFRTITPNLTGNAVTTLFKSKVPYTIQDTQYFDDVINISRDTIKSPVVSAVAMYAHMLSAEEGFITKSVFASINVSQDSLQVENKKAKLSQTYGLDIDDSGFIYVTGVYQSKGYVKKINIKTNQAYTILENYSSNPGYVAVYNNPNSGGIIYIRPHNRAVPLKFFCTSKKITLPLPPDYDEALNQLGITNGSGVQAPGMAVDSQGNLFFGSQNRILKWDRNTDQISVYAGSAGAGSNDGPLDVATFGTISDICFDIIGDMYICDTDNNRIRKITSSSPIPQVSTYCLNIPAPLRIDITNATNILYVTSINNNIYKVSKFDSFELWQPNSYYTCGLTVGFDDVVYWTQQQRHVVFSRQGNGEAKIKFGTDFVAGIEDGAFNESTTLISNAAAQPFYENVTNLAIGGTPFIQNTVSDLYAGNIFGNFAGDAVVNNLTFVSPKAGTSNLAQFSINSSISSTDGIAVDANGTVLVTDSNNHSIRRVFANGAVVTLAGNGTAGYANNVDGAKVLFNNPTGLQQDTNGDLYVTDTKNHIIRKVTASGETTTHAGEPFVSGTYDAGRVNVNKAEAIIRIIGNWYPYRGNYTFIADTLNNRVVVINDETGEQDIYGSGTAGSADNVNASLATFNNPSALVYDGTNNWLYVAEAAGHKIRKIDLNKKTITTVAGSGTAGGADNNVGISATFNGIRGMIGINTNIGDSYWEERPEVYYTAPEALLVAENAGHKIRRVALSGTNPVITIAGTGTAGNQDTMLSGTNMFVSKITANATLNGPWGLAAGNDGWIYFTETGSHKIRRVNLNYNYFTSLTASSFPSALYQVQTIAGGGGGYRPGSVGVAGFTTSERISAGVTLLSASTFNAPKGIAALLGGSRLVVCDSNNHHLRYIQPYYDAWDIMYNASQNRDPNTYHPYGGMGSWTTFPTVSDQLRNGINGAFPTTTFFAGSTVKGDRDGNNNGLFDVPTGLYNFERYNELFVTETGTSRLRKVNSDYISIFTTTIYNSSTPIPAKFDSPTGICMHAATKDLYIADTANNKIRKFNAATKEVTTIAGNGLPQDLDYRNLARFEHINDIVVVPAASDASVVYVAENYRIRKIDQNGIVTTFAGRPTQTIPGEFGRVDGTGTSAAFYNIVSMCADATNIYVVDAGYGIDKGDPNVPNFKAGDVVRKIVIATGAVSTLAGGPFNNADSWTFSGAPYEQNADVKQIVTNQDGTRVAYINANGFVYTTTFAASQWFHNTTTTWTQRLTANFENKGTYVSRNWSSIAMSPDGSRLIAAEYPGKLYTSTDYGVTWTMRASSINTFYNEASSYGNNPWTSVAVNGGVIGTNTVWVATMENGRIYTSSDANTWTPRASAANWRSVASSTNGGTIIAAAYDFNATFPETGKPGRVAISIDSGATFKTLSSTATFDADGGWKTVCITGDGTKMMAANDGWIYASNNAGTTWTGRGFNSGWWDWADYAGLVMSSDGSVRGAAAIYSQSGQGFIGSSTDDGYFWPRVNPGNFNSIAMTSDGVKRVVVGYGGFLFSLSGSDVSYGYYNATGSKARFGSLRGIDVDGSSNVYVADGYFSNIRKITSAGVVTTVAGPSPSAVYSWSNPFYASFPLRGNADGNLEAARFGYPYDVCVDTANSVLFVSDIYTQNIRIINLSTLVTRTFCGPLSSEAADPASGSVDAAGYVDGTPSNVRFSYPISIDRDASNNLYVVDQTSHLNRLHEQGFVNSFVGGASFAAEWDHSVDPRTNGGYPWGPNSTHGVVIRKINTTGTSPNLVAGQTTTFVGGVNSLQGKWGDAGTPCPEIWDRTDYGDKRTYRLIHPAGIAYDPTNNFIYAAEGYAGRVTKIGTTGNIPMTTFAGKLGRFGYEDTIQMNTRNARECSLHNPTGVLIDATAANLYITDGMIYPYNQEERKTTGRIADTRRIKKLNLSTGIITTLAGGNPLDLVGVTDLNNIPNNNCIPIPGAPVLSGSDLIVSSGAGQIWKILTNGTVLTAFNSNRKYVFGDTISIVNGQIYAATVLAKNVGVNSTINGKLVSNPGAKIGEKLTVINKFTPNANDVTLVAGDGTANYLDSPNVTFNITRNWAVANITSNNLSLDLTVASLFRVTLNQNITTLSIVNPPIFRVYEFNIQFIADGTARTVAWPSTVKWQTAPTITATAGKADTFVFLTYDGGTTWYARILGQNQ